MPIFFSQCNKDFNFEDIPSDRPVFCPDCGLSATILDAAELLKRTKDKDSIKSSNSYDTDSFSTNKLPPLNPVGTKKTVPPSSASADQPRTTWIKDRFHTERTKKTVSPSWHYSRRKILILSSDSSKALLKVNVISGSSSAIRIRLAEEDNSSFLSCNCCPPSSGFLFRQ